MDGDNDSDRDTYSEGTYDAANKDFYSESYSTSYKPDAPTDPIPSYSIDYSDYYDYYDTPSTYSYDRPLYQPSSYTYTYYNYSYTYTPSTYSYYSNYYYPSYTYNYWGTK